MTKWNRRRALLAGLGAGLGISGGFESYRYRQAKGDPDSRDALAEYADVVEAAYASEAAWQEELGRLLDSTEPDPEPPPVPYDREASARLIRSCRLAVSQYRTALEVPGFNGDLSELDGFQRFFPGYTKIATFEAEEEHLERYLEVAEPTDATLALESPLERVLRPVRRTLRETVPRIVRREFRRRVFFGFVLTSERDHIMAFRGTQTQAEWLSNLRSSQTEARHPVTGEALGRVHFGFSNIAGQNLRTWAGDGGPSRTPAEVAAELDPSKPCYITGHSLGAALATLTAIDVAAKVDRPSDWLRLYTYAGPRVGDATFAESFARLVPNAYRVANLADTVPLLPSSKMAEGFSHVGEPWTFLAQFGDLLPNHVADTYLKAVTLHAEQRGRRRGIQTPGPDNAPGSDPVS
ncbi:lipase family protein [Tautonia rosea]|uniref:lipase family protein n=1 Tax=Tautonia rosea TaxID=2728037 RepID=UPI0014741570|nr:lipase family protein [Tautonia rosea]